MSARLATMTQVVLHFEIEYPGAEASAEAWESFIPSDELPNLRQRKTGYFLEPWIGIIVVSVISALLIWSTTSVPPPDVASDAKVLRLARKLIWAWAAVAASCTAYILFGEAGVITRSPENCYPIPEAIAGRLVRGESLEKMRNVKEVGPGGRTYCVRCLLWRPREQNCHHCGVCQRCVSGFNHHCGVFGRCVVKGNMPCFVLVIAMMVAGWLTASMATLS